MSKISEVTENIKGKKIFGDIPAYYAEHTKNFIYVCENDGQFHRGNAKNISGYATFVGKFTVEKARRYFLCP